MPVTLIWIIFALCIAGLILWVVSQLPLDPLIAKLIRVVVVVVAVIYVLYLLVGLLAGMAPPPHAVR